MAPTKNTPRKGKVGGGKSAPSSRVTQARVTKKSAAAGSSGTKKKTPTKEWNFTHLPITAEERKKNGRMEGRNLITWGRPRMAEKLLLHIFYEVNRFKIDMPWDQIAHRLHPGSTGGAIQQFMTRMRSSLIVEGHLVPPQNQKPGSRTVVDPKVRGYMRVSGEPGQFSVRPVPFAEPCEDARFNMPEEVPASFREVIVSASEDIQETDNQEDSDEKDEEDNRAEESEEPVSTVEEEDDDHVDAEGEDENMEDSGEQSEDEYKEDGDSEDEEDEEQCIPDDTPTRKARGKKAATSGSPKGKEALYPSQYYGGKIGTFGGVTYTGRPGQTPGSFSGKSVPDHSSVAGKYPPGASPDASCFANHRHVSRENTSEASSSPKFKREEEEEDNRAGAGRTSPAKKVAPKKKTVTQAKTIEKHKANKEKTQPKRATDQRRRSLKCELENAGLKSIIEENEREGRANGSNAPDHFVRRSQRQVKNSSSSPSLVSPPSPKEDPFAFLAGPVIKEGKKSSDKTLPKKKPSEAHPKNVCVAAVSAGANLAVDNNGKEDKGKIEVGQDKHEQHSDLYKLVADGEAEKEQVQAIGASTEFSGNTPRGPAASSSGPWDFPDSAKIDFSGTAQHLQQANQQQEQPQQQQQQQQQQQPENLPNGIANYLHPGDANNLVLFDGQLMSLGIDQSFAQSQEPEESAEATAQDEWSWSEMEREFLTRPGDDKDE